MHGFHHLAKVRVAGSSPVVRSVGWRHNQPIRDDKTALQELCALGVTLPWPSWWQVIPSAGFRCAP